MGSERPELIIETLDVRVRVTTVTEESLQGVLQAVGGQNMVANPDRSEEPHNAHDGDVPCIMMEDVSSAQNVLALARFA